MPDLHDLLERRARNLRPAPMPTAFDRAMRRAERRHRNRRIGAAALALVVFAGAGTGLWIAFQPSAERHAPPAAEFPIPGTTSTIALPSAPTGLAVAPDGSLLVTTGTTLDRLDPVTNRIHRLFSDAKADLTGVAVVSYRIPEYPEDFVFAWLSDRSGFARWVLLDAPPEFLAHAETACCDSIDVGGPALGVAVGAGSVWVTVAHDGPGDLVRIDARTNRITGRFTTGDGPGAVAIGEGGVWVQVTSGNARLQRFDPSTGELVGEEEGGGLVAATTDEAWASGSDTVQRVMPGTAVAVPIISPEPSGALGNASLTPSAHVPGAGALTISDDQVWAVANPNPDQDGLLYEIDRRTGDIVGAPTPVGLTPTAVAVADGSVWVANFNDATLTRVQLVCGDTLCGSPATPTPPAPTTGPTATPSAVGSLDSLPMPFVLGRRLVGGGFGFDEMLAAPPDTRENGGLSPAATFLPDGRLLYLAWDPGLQGTEVHVFDPRTGADDVRLVNASSVAVRVDGPIAFSGGNADIHTQPLLPSPTASPAPLGGIEVAPDARFDSTVPWVSGEGTYVAVGWAGGTLLASHQGPGGVSDVLAIDGPNLARTLAAGAEIVAISPDGMEVMLAGQVDGSSIPDTVEVVRVADGSVVTSTSLSGLIDPVAGTALGTVENSGDWTGDEVVAGTSAGAALLKVGPTISVERVLPNADDGPPTTGIHEPQFVAGDPTQIVGWTSLITHGPQGSERDGIVACAESSEEWSCSVPGGATPGHVRPVRSLSRPAALDVSGTP